MENETKLWLTLGILGVVILIVAYTISGSITGNIVAGKKEIIKIGVMVPLSGEFASYGLNVQRGIEMSMNDFGLDNIKIIYKDSKCTGNDAISAINNLISIDRVEAIIGEFCSEATLAAVPFAQRTEIIMISPASKSPAITDAGSYIFRTVPSDALHGDFGANLVYNRGYRKLGILYGNDDYGREFRNFLSEKFQGEVVASEAFESGATDLEKQIENIKNSGADAVYIVSNSIDSAVASLKQIKELGVNAGIFGSEGLKNQRIIDGAGSAAEGLILMTLNYGNSNFAIEYNRTYGDVPGPFAAQGYDAFKALAITIRDGARTGKEIKNKLYGIEFDGASGKIKFDANGDVPSNYSVFQVVQGKFIII